jgi:ATP-dependent DNA ligase
MQKPPTFPARPINGGPLDKALPKDGEWLYEPKYNGWRALVHIATGAMFNRKGEPLSIAKEFQPALDQLRVTLDCQAFKWADCEALERRHKIGQGTLIILDVLPEPEYRGYALTDRRAWLNLASLPIYYPDPDHKPAPNTICRTSSVTDEDAPRAWRELQQINSRWGCEFFEGLVAKRADSPYPFQLRSPDIEFHLWMKHRWAF